MTDLLDIARSQIGYKEGTNNDNKYGIWYGDNHDYWCGMFVSWCFDQAGVPLRGVQSAKGFGYCPTAVNWFKANKAWFGKPVARDIGFLADAHGLAEHTFIVESVTPLGVYTIEGNTNNNGSANGDGVYRRFRAEHEIMGYGRWPNLPQPTQSEPVMLPPEVDATLCPTGGHWVLTADGGVRAIGGAPYLGSYPGLPEAARQGVRSFIGIEATATGYAIFGNDDTVYAFPV